MSSLEQFAVHTMTNKPWSLAQCCDAYASKGFGGISVWRNVIEPIGIDEASRIVKDSGLWVPAIVRGGFFVSLGASRRTAALDDNKACLDEAAALGADQVVLVVGAEPGVPLADARSMVRDGIADCIAHAEAVGVKLAIEPLHPMYAADKSCVNRIAEARAICDALDHPVVGVAVDAYHCWWDPNLEDEIAALGRENRLFGFHVCDWRVETRHLLTDRELMGRGCIDLASMTRFVREAGFTGLSEVEIFSEQYWGEDQDAYLTDIAAAAEHLHTCATTS